MPHDPEPSLWDALTLHGVPREYRTLACVAFASWLEAQTAAMTEQAIDLWPAES